MRYFLLFISLFVALSLGAQQRLEVNQNIYNTQGVGLVYDQELTFHAGLLTPRSFFLGVQKGKLETYFRTKFWSVEAGDIRSIHEQRSSLERIILATNRVSRPFVYAKQNQLYVLRAGFGNRIYLTEKARQRGVAMGYSWQLGPTLGLLKPYYLEVETGEGGTAGVVRDIRFTEENAALFLDRFRIFGASVWSRGFDEMRLVPGIHARASIHFGFGAYEELAKAFEVGLHGDFFLTNAPIMVETPLAPNISNSNLHLNLFLKMQFGKRW